MTFSYWTVFPNPVSFKMKHAIVFAVEHASQEVHIKIFINIRTHKEMLSSWFLSGLAFWK